MLEHIDYKLQKWMKVMPFKLKIQKYNGIVKFMVTIW